MKKILALVFVAIFFGCVSAQSQLQHTWEEVDQAVTDVQNAQPVPSGVLVPAGGTTGQVLGKNSDTDGDTGWIDQTGGGTSVLKWYRQINSLTADTTSYILARPFDDWKITGLVGLTDTGTIDLDVQMCDSGNQCASYLTGLVTLANPEVNIVTAYDGITANHYIKLIPSNPQGGVTRFDVYASGTYETGNPPPYVPSCDPAVDYVGFKEIGNSNVLTNPDTTRLIKDVYPTCNGEADQFFIYLDSDHITGVRVSVYEQHSDLMEDALNTLATEATFDTDGTIGWYSVALPAGHILDPAQRYILAFSLSTVASQRPRRDDTTTASYGYITDSGWYDNGSPANLGSVSISTATYDLKGIYVSIK